MREGDAAPGRLLRRVTESPGSQQEWRQGDVEAAEHVQRPRVGGGERAAGDDVDLGALPAGEVVSLDTG